MCTRLYPDIIVASEIRERICQIAVQNGLDCDQVAVTDNFLGDLKYIYVSSTGCTKKQEGYKNLGLVHTFIGYDNKEWTKEDYQQYFLHMPNKFIPVEGSPTMFQVSVEDFYKLERRHLHENVTELIKWFCQSFLETDRYGERTLNTLGIC